MGQLEKLKITRWDVTKQAKTGQAFVAMINPDGYAIKRMFEGGRKKSRVEHESETLTLNKIVVDGTGVVRPADGMPATVEGQLAILNAAATTFDGGKVVYPVVHVAWGKLAYIGRVTSIDNSFTLFKPDGTPLRAEITIQLAEYKEQNDPAAAGGAPADTGSQAQVTEGASLPALCVDEYGDDSMVETVAAYNNLDSIRNVPAGTTIDLPKKS